MTGTCSPACVSGSRFEWMFATVTGRTTFRLTTTSTGLGEYVRLFLIGGNAGCVVGCPVEIKLKAPAIKTTLAYASGAPVVDGANLHVKAGATANASPIEGILVVELPDGLGAPTNITGGATYSAGPPSGIEGLIVLGPSGGFEFDIPVTAANGTAPTVNAWFVPSWSGPTVTNASLVVKVGSDTAAPTVTAPTATLWNGSRASGAPVRVAWTSSDAGSGVERHVLSQQVDGGTWKTLYSSLSATNVVRALGNGHTYRFRVRAVDHAGNAGAWKYGSTFRLTGHTEASGTLRYTGTWATSSSTSFWGGHAKKATAVGAKASYTTTMRSVSWVTTTGPTRGRARVYVNGTFVATVDLWAPSTAYQRVVWSRSWSTAASRTVTIKVTTAYGRPSVFVDGMLAIR